jgi:TPR repeat protein
LAADQGNAEGQTNLGYSYANGWGVPQDYAEALKWYRLAADQGNAGAQTNLGYSYANGQGVSQDYAEALKWFRLAADQGLADAQVRLAGMYVNGQGVPQDYAEAAKWVRLAADQSNALAQDALGFMYANGQGVPQDYEEAAKWYRKAADQGNADAKGKLGLFASATSKPSTNEQSDRPFLDCTRTGPHGEYTEDDFARDTTGMPRIGLEWMTEIISMMNCGQPFNRYTVDDFMCDPRFKGLSWHQAKSMARIMSIATCGQLPVNSTPAEPRRSPKIIMDMGGGLLMEMPN